MSLDAKEVELITNSWSKVNTRSAGSALFYNLFKDYPKYQEHFKHFKGMSIDEVKVSKKIAAHGTRVMHLVGVIVESLDDPEILTEVFAKMGRDHKARDIPLKAFEDTGPIVIRVLKEALGSSVMNDQTTNAWLKLYSVLLANLKHTLD